MTIDWHDILPDDIFAEFSLKTEFEKDFKDLYKRWQTLDKDFNNFVDTQLKLHHKKEPDNQATNELTYVDPSTCSVYKTKRFTCRALAGTGGKSGIRVIHAYYPERDRVEFVEIYYKGDKKNEDRARIKNYYG